MEKEKEDENITAFNDVLLHMQALYKKKNQDYGNSFDKSLDRYGISAGLVRMSDKMNRLENIFDKEPMVHNERLKDTLIDMACYAAMTLSWLQRKGL